MNSDFARADGNDGFGHEEFSIPASKRAFLVNGTERSNA